MVLRCSAARPRDASGDIIQDVPCIQQIYKSQNQLFNLPVFQTPQFTALQTQIRNAEQAEIAHGPLTSSHSTGLSPLVKRVQDVVRKEMSPVRAFFNSNAGERREHMPAPSHLFPQQQKEQQKEQSKAASAMMGLQRAGIQKPRKPKKSRGEHVAKNMAKVGNKYGFAGDFQPATSVAQMWREFDKGVILDGRQQPSLRSLNENHGKAWRRCFAGALRKEWHWRHFIYDKITKLIASGCVEADAIDSLHQQYHQIQLQFPNRQKVGCLRELSKRLAKQVRAAGAAAEAAAESE